MLIFFAEGESGKTFVGLSPALGLDPEMREGTRFVGPFTAIWYLVFMIPFFLWMREVPCPATHGRFGAALSELWGTVKSLPKRTSLFAYLGSSMFYRDALNALYGFGGTYAVLVLNWSVTQVGVFGIVGAITAAVATWIGGKLDARLGPKPVIIGSILVLIAVCGVVVGMTRESLWGIALVEGSAVPDITFLYLWCADRWGGRRAAIGLALDDVPPCHGGPPDRSLWAIRAVGQGDSVLGPALIGVTTYLTESARLGMIPLIGLFVLGLILIIWVRAEGEVRG
jgi:Permeases of the major facilitator superfamily